MRIIITGATGNVGTALLKRLQEARSEEGADLELVGVARREPDETRLRTAASVEWHSLDCRGSEQAAGTGAGARPSRRHGAPGLADTAQP